MKTFTITVSNDYEETVEETDCNVQWKKFANKTKTVLLTTHELTKTLTEKVDRLEGTLKRLEGTLKRLEEQVKDNFDEICILQYQNKALRKLVGVQSPIELDRTTTAFKANTKGKATKVPRVPTPIPSNDCEFATPKKENTTLDEPTCDIACKQTLKRCLEKTPPKPKTYGKKLKVDVSNETSTPLTRCEEV
jgi:hypothetical protein